MNKIERDTNWRSVDKLDGREIAEGDHLIVRWPDGQLQQIKASVDVGTFECGEQGGSYTARRSHAFIIAYHRGVQVRVPLYGLEAQWVASD
jgi:hypothetical protein